MTLCVFYKNKIIVNFTLISSFVILTNEAKKETSSLHDVC